MVRGCGGEREEGRKPGRRFGKVAPPVSQTIIRPGAY